MAASSFTARIPAGMGGMTARRNRTLIKNEELILAENVSFTHGMISRSGGTLTAYNPTVASATISFSSTLTISDGWATGAYLFPSTGTPNWSSGVAVDTASNTAGTSLTITLTESHTADTDPRYMDVDVLIVAWTYGIDIDSVTDTAGRIWIPVGGMNNTPDNTYQNQLYMARQDPYFPDLLVDGTITITFSASCASVAACGSCAAISPSSGWTNRSSATSTTATATFESVRANDLAMVIILTDAVGTVSSTPSGWTERIEITPATGLPGIHVYTDIVNVGESTIACTEFWPRVETAVSGAITTTAGSVSFSGTSINTQIYIGDEIVVSGHRRRVATTGASSGTVTVAFNAAVTASATVWAGPRLIWAAENGAVYKSFRASAQTAPVSLISAGTLNTGARTGFFLPCGMEATGSAAKLFYMNGTDTVRELTSDSATMSAIANPNTDWASGNTPTGGVVHQGRVFLFGVAGNPFTMYASSPTDHEDFTTANTATRRYQVDSSVGERIMAAVVFEGLLHIWKYPVGIFYLDDADLTSANWGIYRKSGALGCARSPHAVLAMDDDVMFLDANAQFHLLSAVSTLGGTTSSNLSEHLGIGDWMRERVSLVEPETICSYWDTERKIAYWGLCVGSGLRPAYLMGFDFSGTARGEDVKVFLNTRDVPSALCGSRDLSYGVMRTLVAESGNVFTRLDAPIPEVSVKADDIGSYQAFVSFYQTPFTDFSWVEGGADLEFKRKIFEALEIEFEPIKYPDNQDGDVTVQVWIDYVLRETLTFDPSLRRQRKTLHCGDGFTFSLRVISQHSPQDTELYLSDDFQIIAHTVWFQEGAEDHNRAV